MLLHLARALAIFAAAASALPSLTAQSRQTQWQSYAADLLNEVMVYMDGFYDPYAGYLIDTDINNGFAALYHTTRESSWYAAGLLARNKGDDKDQAAKIISNIISKQNHNATALWYGDYQVFPEEPEVGSAAYPAVIYNSWDPNWRPFVATAFMVIVEEFSDLLTSHLIEQMVESVLLAAKGNTYRGCHVNEDNFCTAYSNPVIMSAAFAGWAGIRTKDANITEYGETLAKEVVALFDEYDTLSEFNCPTYAGVSVFALTLWAKYFPAGTVWAENGGRLITSTWQTLGEMYNANLKNMAGPWDRTYGWDMNRYVAITSLWIWGLVGKEHAPGYSNPADMAHVSDFQFAVFNAILGPYHNSFVSTSTIQALSGFSEEHTVTKQVYSPPYDLAPRNVTTWLSSKLTIGMESFREDVEGGPSLNPSSFSPAVVQWLREDGFVGFISLYSDTYEMQGNVSANQLTLTYPVANASSQFTFFVSPNGLQAPHTLYGWEDLDGIDVKVSGTVDPTPTIAYCGAQGGTCEPVDLFELWNFTYSMPPGSTELPSITLDITLSY